MPAYFTIEQRLDYFSFTFTGEDQSILFFSRLYISLVECKKAITALQHLNDVSRYAEKTEDKGEYSFFVRSKVGEVPGHGVVYFASSSRDYAIRKLCMQIAAAKVVEPEPFQREATYQLN